MKTKPIEEIQALCDKYAAPIGLTVDSVEFKQGKNPALTVFIDKDGGVTLDDCEKLHNAIFDPLDELDPTYGLPYTLNVSSLGADRPFKKERDFLSHIGKKVEVRLYASVKGKKFYEGELLSYDGEHIVIKVDDNNTLSFDLKSVVKVSEYIDF
ncbi:MAG: ribosome maturation factor RimP [Clostridia bacterium]|nr:ribosome maturation factor RimP [Clostridia bacterium]